MRKQPDIFALIPNRDPASSVVAALARACILLKAGNLADAARWTAIAASRSEAEAP